MRKVKIKIPEAEYEPKRQLCVRGVKERNIEFLQETAAFHGYDTVGELMNIIIEGLMISERRNKVRGKS